MLSLSGVQVFQVFADTDKGADRQITIIKGFEDPRYSRIFYLVRPAALTALRIRCFRFQVFAWCGSTDNNHKRI
jgi:hypothetical protein